MEVPMAQSNEANTNVTTPVEIEDEGTRATVDNTYGIQLADHKTARERNKELLEVEEDYNLESQLHVDVVQLLALGRVSYDSVWEKAVKMSKELNDYSPGRTFDIFEAPLSAYSEHLRIITESIETDSVVDGLVYSNKHKVVRQQLTIMSGLTHEVNARTGASTGRKFYHVSTRYQSVTTGSYGAVRTLKEKSGARTKLRLYVEDRTLSNGNTHTVFRFEGQAIALGEVSVYTNIRSKILATFKPLYDDVINSFSDNLLVQLTEGVKHNQLVFMTVFQQAKPALWAARAELAEMARKQKAAEEQKAAGMASQAMTNAEANASVKVEAK